MYQSTRLLAYGFIIILMMMVSLALIAFNYTNNNSDVVNFTFTRQIDKINLINELSNIVNNRTRYMQSLLLNENEPINAVSLPDFSRFNGSYDKTRARLLPLLTPRERDIMVTF